MPDLALSSPDQRRSPPPPACCADGHALADGPARENLRVAMDQLSWAESAQGSGHAAVLCHALTEVARALSGLHAYSPAENYLAKALRLACVMGATDSHGDLCCALAEVATNVAELAEARGEPVHAVRAARNRARDHAFEAAGLAAHTADPQWEIKLLLRASDVLDRCGDHDDAVRLQHRALVLMGLTNSDLPDAAWPGGDAASDTPQAAAGTTLM
jgi:hypothetical protein